MLIRSFKVLFVLSLAACATGERLTEPDVGGDPRAIVCREHYIAVCVDIDCQPEEYRCMDEESAKKLLGENL